jgi:broad specificity phosphatase PhoE
MAVVRLVRHGHAAAGFSADPDPGLDDLGREQARTMAAALAPLGPLPVVVSPLRRTRETAGALESLWGREAVVDERVAEIPSPTTDLEARGAWLRAAMAGTWADLGAEYTSWRGALVDAVCSLADDTVVVSHFVAINAVVGWSTGDDRVMCAPLANCSVTTVTTRAGRLEVVELGATAVTEVR